MRKRFVLALLLALPLHAQTAADLVRASMSAMGGEERLRGIHAVELKAIGHRNALEQSERPEGPWFVEYMQLKEIRDFDHERLRDDAEYRGYETEWWHSAEWRPGSMVLDGGVAFDTGAGHSPRVASFRNVQPAEESLEFGPERLLLNALAAKDLTREADAPLHGFNQHVIRFTKDQTTVRVWINPWNSYPAAVDLIRTRPVDVFWSPWGDITTRITWNLWTLEPNGIHYPRQWTFESNGLPERSLSIHELRWNPPLDPSTFPDFSTIRGGAAKLLRAIDDAPFGLPDRPPVEVAKKIVQVPGYWDVGEVRQHDGIVMIEGPMSSAYSAKAIEDAGKRFPGLKVKAVVTTSDSWPHIGGLREYFARGIEVYALDLNGAILKRLAAAPHSLSPDSLQKHPRAPRLHLVSSRTVLGEGAERMELIPLRSVTGERQMVIWFPESKTLYTSDLFAKQPDGTWWLPQYLSELASVVERERLTPEVIFGMHYGPTPWSDLVKALRGSG